MSVDRKTRAIGVSIKAKDMQEEEDAIKEHREKEQDLSPTTLGDLIKQKMDADTETETDTDTALSIEADKEVESSNEPVDK